MKSFPQTAATYLAIISCLLMFFSVAPVSVIANHTLDHAKQQAGAGSQNSTNTIPRGGQTSQNTTGVLPSVALESPLKNIGSIEGLLVAILNIIIILMIPIIVFFIILAGFKYVTAQGNASQVEDATRALTYAIIGGVLILGAVAISRIIANVVQSF